MVVSRRAQLRSCFRHWARSVLCFFSYLFLLMLLTTDPHKYAYIYILSNPSTHQAIDAGDCFAICNALD